MSPRKEVNFVSFTDGSKIVIPLFIHQKAAQQPKAALQMVRVVHPSKGSPTAKGCLADGRTFMVKQVEITIMVTR